MTSTFVWSRRLVIPDDDDATDTNGVNQGRSVTVIVKLDDEESGRRMISPSVSQLLLLRTEDEITGDLRIDDDSDDI